MFAAKPKDAIYTYYISTAARLQQVMITAEIQDAMDTD